MKTNNGVWDDAGSAGSTLEHTLQQVTRALVERFRPVRVILFGSQARGEPRRDSDVDLLVVTECPPPRAVAWRIARSLAPELPLQLVFMERREWEETRDVVGGIAYPAAREGRVLYAA